MKDYLIAERPETLEGYTPKIETPCGTLYLTLNEYENQLFEVRLSLGKVGNCTNVLLQTIAILLSVLLQAKIPRDKIAKTLHNRIDCHCPNPFWKDGIKYSSCVDWIVRRILEDMLNRGDVKPEDEIPQ